MSAGSTLGPLRNCVCQARRCTWSRESVKASQCPFRVLVLIRLVPGGCARCFANHGTPRWLKLNGFVENMIETSGKHFGDAPIGRGFRSSDPHPYVCPLRMRCNGNPILGRSTESHRLSRTLSSERWYVRLLTRFWPLDEICGTTAFSPHDRGQVLSIKLYRPIRSICRSLTTLELFTTDVGPESHSSFLLSLFSLP